MTLRTAFTDLFAITHPVMLAPMGGTAGGALAAAVSNAGGLGIVGGGYGYRERLERELPLVAEGTSQPWGVGFISWDVADDDLAYALEFRPTAVMSSFADPARIARHAKDAGAKLIVQVTTLDEARRALDVGADLLVAQGTEAGGHGGRRSTLPFVPAVVDLAGATPVLAAGGIADGRGLAAALTLGAAGAMLGSRFVATTEAVSTDAERRAIVDGTGEGTDRSSLIDIGVGKPWPGGYTLRALRNPWIDTWRDREGDFAADGAARAAFTEALMHGDRSVVPVAAGEAVDLIHDVPSAGDVVTTLVSQAEAALRAVAIS